jgi:hypothetical protein
MVLMQQSKEMVSAPKAPDVLRMKQENPSLFQSMGAS